MWYNIVMKSLFKSIRIYETNRAYSYKHYNDRIEFVIDDSKLKQLYAFILPGFDNYGVSRVGDGANVLRPQNYKEFFRLLKKVKFEDGKINVHKVEYVPVGTKVPCIKKGSLYELMCTAEESLINKKLSKDERAESAYKFYTKYKDILYGLGFEELGFDLLQ